MHDRFHYISPTWVSIGGCLHQINIHISLAEKQSHILTVASAAHRFDYVHPYSDETVRRTDYAVTSDYWARHIMMNSNIRTMSQVQVQCTITDRERNLIPLEKRGRYKRAKNSTIKISQWKNISWTEAIITKMRRSSAEMSGFVWTDIQQLGHSNNIYNTLNTCQWQSPIWGREEAGQ